MKTLTPTDTTPAVALPSTSPASLAGPAVPADPLAAMLSFAEQMLAGQQQPAAAPAAAPTAEPPAGGTSETTDTSNQAVDLAGTLPQALAVALQLQPPAAMPAKAAKAAEHEDHDEHDDGAPAALAPAAAAATLPAAMAMPVPAAQDPAPAVAADAARPMPMPVPMSVPAQAPARAHAIETQAFTASVDTQPAAADDDAAAGAAAALPVLGNSSAAGVTDAKFSLPQAAPALHLPHGDAQQWQSPLLQALGDRIQLQIATRSETATIRLEPPQMGRVDIAVRQDAAGSLQVNLSATHGEVVHQLQQISEGMRWNLAQQRPGGEVVVQVSAAAPDAGAAGAGRDGDARSPRQPWQPRDEDAQRPGRALAAGDESTPSFALS